MTTRGTPRHSRGDVPFQGGETNWFTFNAANTWSNACSRYSTSAVRPDEGCAPFRPVRPLGSWMESIDGRLARPTIEKMPNLCNG